MTRLSEAGNASLIGLERPYFGHFARQQFGMPAKDLGASLAQQAQTGGRLGEIFRNRGLIDRSQVLQVLRAQARWVTDALQADVMPRRFPYPGLLSLCLPAYNEESNIEDTLDAACVMLPEFVEAFEVVVVDDGSRDRTAEIVTSFARQDPRVRLVQHDTNLGYGAAVGTGLKAARGDLSAFVDSDGQFSLLDLPQLLVRLDGSDVVVGYRHRRADRWNRRLNAWAWTRLNRLILGVPARDLDCAFKLFRRSALDQLRLTATSPAINAEILVQCVRRGLRVAQTPVTHYPRYHGVAFGCGLKMIRRALVELPDLWWRYRVRGLSDRMLDANGPLAPPVSDPTRNGHSTPTDTSPRYPAAANGCPTTNGARPCTS